MRGSAVVSRALPSFSVIEIIPVSATQKFAPVDAHVRVDDSAAA